MSSSAKNRLIEKMGAGGAPLYWVDCVLPGRGFFDTRNFLNCLKQQTALLDNRKSAAGKRWDWTADTM